MRGTADDQQLSLFDRATGVPSNRVFTTPGNIPGVPAFEGDYHTVELALNRRFHGKWLLLTSFEHTWADDFRTTTTGTGSLDVVRQTTTYLWQPNRRRLGRQTSTYWNYKVVSRYVLPLRSPSVFTIPDYQIQNLLSLIQSFSNPAR